LARSAAFSPLTSTRTSGNICLVGQEEAGQRLLGYNRLLDLHAQNNRATAASWERFASHRSRVTELLRAAGGETLAILGAGNCNDVDLELLGQQFREIHLVDIDRAAVERARQWQAPGRASSVVTHAPVDLSGCLEALPRYRNEVPDITELAQWPRNAASRAFGAVTMTFDTVASVCMLSQLMQACAVGLGVDHPCLQVIACATAVAHLRSLVRMVNPGGTAILITDVVSSETFSFEERLARGVDPLDVLAQIDKIDASLSGTGPTFTLEIMGGDAEIGPALETPRLVSPWAWRFNDEVLYLVYGLVAKKKPAP
jgi:hypothetical protein